jgi:predicted neuraminidase
MKRFRHIFITVVIVLLLFSAVAYGGTWTTTKRLTYNAGWSEYPAIAVDGSNIYVVWQDNTPASHSEIYFKKSDDGGDTWTTNKRLTYNAGYSEYPAIAVDASNIYVVWQDDTPGNHEIYFKKSDDGGDTWTTSKRFTNNVGSSRRPAIAVDGSNIYVVWEDYTPGNAEIYFKKSDDRGDTWTTNKRLTYNAGISEAPVIAVDSSNIYVVWNGWTPGFVEIYFKKSDDRGDTWTTSKRLTNNLGDFRYPAIAVDGLNIYLVWTDFTPGNYEIYFKKSDDGGATWATNKKLTNDVGDSQYPAIAVGGSNIYVVWQYSLPVMPLNFEIYFKKGVLF